MMSRIKNNRGFTLIELLVVISVISLLSSIVFSALSNARAKARDAQRVSEVKQIQNALELYRAQNGGFPLSTTLNAGAVCGSTVVAMSAWCNDIDVTSWNLLKTALTSYISKLPKDPKPGTVGTDWGGSANGGSYSYFSNDSRWYMLVYRLETRTVLSPGVTDCSLTNYNYGGSGQTNIVTVGMSCY